MVIKLPSAPSTTVAVVRFNLPFSTHLAIGQFIELKSFHEIGLKENGVRRIVDANPDEIVDDDEQEYVEQH